MKIFEYIKNKIIKPQKVSPFMDTHEYTMLEKCIIRHDELSDAWYKRHLEDIYK